MNAGSVWQGVFAPGDRGQFPLFVNSVITDSEHSVAFSDWACYPDAYALLGFIQYVYMPTYFCQLIHPEEQRLYTLLAPQETLMEAVRSSGNPRTDLMVYFLETASGLWALCRHRLLPCLLDFCEMFSNAFTTYANPVQLRIYANATDISSALKRVYWCEQLFREDIGIGMNTMTAMCHFAQEMPQYRTALVAFLNHKCVTMN